MPYVPRHGRALSISANKRCVRVLTLVGDRKRDAWAAVRRKMNAPADDKTSDDRDQTGTTQASYFVDLPLCVGVDDIFVQF